ncbi:MAG TPA: DUF4259 domain-containing protein [Hymenobacter sp.]|jgi:hypothetical protein|uniref:DUF4259 domain-containing protein n=1 Tax=Hymenobacter sp. TaxID=1898978 RepID=UPI002ED9780E
MGVWGVGSFENDQAYNWLNDFLAHPSREPLQEVFDYVLNQRDFLDSPESLAALAAAELVAAQLGRPSHDFPPDLDVAQTLAFPVDPELTETATRAVGHILYSPGYSELRELWQEAGNNEYNSWENAVYNLIERLRQRAYALEK